MESGALPMAALTAGWPYQSFATLVADALNCVGILGSQKPAVTMFANSDDDMAGNVAKQAAVDICGTKMGQPA